MSNWFEDNATKSVVGYTILVAGFTWAVSTFVLQDNRLNLLRAEVDSQKAVAEQYKSKTELLQREIDAIRVENQEYRAWLAQTKDALPAIVPRIAELKARVAELENRDPGTSASGGMSSTPEVTVTRGRAYIDAVTGLVLTVVNVNVERQARLQVKLPGQQAIEEPTVYAGAQWKFANQGTNYVLSVVEVNFSADSIRIQLAALPK